LAARAVLSADASLLVVDELAKILERHGVVVKLFADDVKVYLEICHIDDATKQTTDGS